MRGEKGHSNEGEGHNNGTGGLRDVDNVSWAVGMFFFFLFHFHY
jgi:hypothetical protein